MTTRSAIVASAAIFGGALVISIALMVLFIHPTDRDATERARLLGQGMAMLCLFPLAVVWIRWAARVRREREQKALSHPAR